jgi:hypothetical protein
VPAEARAIAEANSATLGVCRYARPVFHFHCALAARARIHFGVTSVSQHLHAIIVGTPTHYGNISSQMTSFWARTGELWTKGALIGKIGGAFSSTGSQHGGNEAAILSMHRTLLHHGLILVGLPYSFQGQLEGGAETGGSP